MTLDRAFEIFGPPAVIIAIIKLLADLIIAWNNRRQKTEELGQSGGQWLLTTLQKQLGEERQERINLGQEVSEVRSELATVRGELAALGERNKHLHEENTRLLTENAELRATVGNLTGENLRYSAESESLKRDLRIAWRRLDELEFENQAQANQLLRTARTEESHEGTEAKPQP
ncbi:hypothetical protein [Deinococcus peraridilitoris]|uniref:Uncharacterized protein n=1 Tax=Deinococcus peraridilitoris (strain DSM 19664 / LMG 22246 / CIP 109416 / KR-200) TaxID=937777 RepID=K9ZZA2_DEIPD|nr:hypothetical protein [Deinococcus peraridilitoris]AFZ66973.1 hypothetical protein Deipe_1432 [Deinococcus peraridilitoris DSM 19664]